MRAYITLICLALFNTVCQGQTFAERTDPQPDESHRAPIGVLGYPLGSYLTIEGVRATQGLGAAQCVLVDTVSGHKLPKSVSIRIGPILPDGVRLVFKGYETGSWGGDAPPEVQQHERYDGPRPQQAWHFYNEFIVTTVVQPTGYHPYPPRKAAP